MAFRVVLDPEQREDLVRKLLELDGLDHIEENPRAAYCPISLTSTPDELKPILKQRQDMLMQDVLEATGITAYDPSTAPCSPDLGLSKNPSVVYAVDSAKVAGARFFTGHNILPSTGVGNEAEKAVKYNKMAVILMDRNIRTSRMQPFRTIYLQYNDFETVVDDLKEIFTILQNFNPGMGLRKTKKGIEIPVLLGFEKDTTKIVDLEETIYREFPQLQYKYDGTKPIVELRAENPEIFYEMIETN